MFQNNKNLSDAALDDWLRTAEYRKQVEILEILRAGGGPATPTDDNKSAMGPNYGTLEYHEQVDMICKACADVPKDVLGPALMLWILDENFSRAAICEAEKKLKKEDSGKAMPD